MSGWVIRLLTDTGDEESLYWSNIDGWVDRDSATVFTDNERWTLNLPVGEDCRWEPAV